MTQHRKPSRSNIDVQKASRFAIVVNAMEIVVLTAFAIYAIWGGVHDGGLFTMRMLAVISALAAGWGAFLDIRQALSSQQTNRTIAQLEHTNTLMDSLNNRLRAQRHDFLNHLQVVYSLLEMGEYTDATDYLEKVYGEIRSVSSSMRTKSTAVNALLQVKTAACEDSGIALNLDITSALEGVPIPAWELCCILSNLLDNAMDAAAESTGPQISLGISENLREYAFTVTNNGPPIPPALLERIFEANVTTKGEGHGMGLHIARQTLAEYGGEIACQSREGTTVFTFTIPKRSV